jgi:hypothetical protein
MIIPSGGLIMTNLIGEITLDKKKGLALGRLLGQKKISSFEVYETDEGYLRDYRSLLLLLILD